MNQQHKHEVLVQGYQVTNEMKADVLEHYFKSLDQREYRQKSEYIRTRLDEKYGRCWSIMVVSNQSECSFSFLHQDDLLLQFKTQDDIVFAYLAALPPPPPVHFNEDRVYSRPQSPDRMYRAPEPLYDSRIRVIRGPSPPPRYYPEYYPQPIIYQYPPLYQTFYDTPQYANYRQSGRFYRSYY